MDIQELRREIDGVDRDLVKLFERRMHLAAEIADYKKKNRLPVQDRLREREVLAQVSGAAGPELEEYAQVLFSTLFDLSRSYQSSLNAEETPLTAEIMAAAENTPKLFPTKGVVACQGVEGAYSQLACDKLFKNPSIMYFRSFGGVFQAVEKGLCQFGVLPIENSSYGSVSGVYDLMHRYRFRIIRSIKLHIDHNLLARPGAKPDGIREIFSHEQAVGQCKYGGGGQNGGGIRQGRPGGHFLRGLRPALRAAGPGSAYPGPGKQLYPFYLYCQGPGCLSRRQPHQPDVFRSP